MADGIPAGLALLDELASSGRLDGDHLLPAARADLLRRVGRSAEAKVAYEEALRLAPTEAERRYLSGRLRELCRLSSNPSPGRCRSRVVSFVRGRRPPHRREVS